MEGSLLAAEIAYQRQRAKQYKGPLVWDFDELLQYAEGNLESVFNKYPSGEHEPWSLVDSYKRRVRLPQREYLLCSRVTKMDATTNKYQPATMTTEYDIPFNGELSEGGDVPWAVLVESGQCDLLLISYLGIDFQCKGVRMYRLLDTTLTFFGVATEGQTLVYDIKINSFAKKGDQVTMFFFEYNCYVDGKLLIEMRNGVAGFFSDEELDAGKGVLHTKAELQARTKIVKRDITPFMLLPPSTKTTFSENDMVYLSQEGAKGWGPILDRDVKYKLCARKMLMIDRITHLNPSGGAHGLGLIIGEKVLERKHWYFPCHFKDDEVMAGSLVSDGCSQLLKVYMVWLGLNIAVENMRFTPVNGVGNKVRCRGQISPHKGKLVYVMEITDIGFDPKTGFPFAFANVDIIDVNFEKGETFDMNKLSEYGQGDLSKKIVVDFKGVALQLEGTPTDKHPTMPRTATRQPESKIERPALVVHVPRPMHEMKCVAPAMTASGLRETLLNLEQPFVVPDSRGAQIEIPSVLPRDLGDKSFMEFYGVDFPVYTGAMAKGIASAELVIANGQRKILSSFGAGGLPKDVVAKALDKIQAALPNGPYAFNLIHSPFDDLMEKFNVELFLSRGVRVVEASAFMKLTPHVVRYRVAGLEKSADGKVICRNKIIFKVSRTELAEMAMRPAPIAMVNKLVEQGYVTQAQAEMSQLVPMADDVAVEADSGGHTDNRPIQVIFPIIVATRNAIQAQYKFSPRVRVGCGGGIGCPSAVHAAFSMGAAFVLTGTVNQMCRQSGTSDRVRKVLSEATYSDVTMAPAADMFDEGVELQVLKKGTMFPNRARKLYELFIRYNGLDDIPQDEVAKLEKNVFKMTIEAVWNETKDFYINRLNDSNKVARAEQAPKLKMSMAFRWYLGNSSRWANIGDASRVLDYQIWCGPAIGSFNEFIKGSFLDPSVSKVFPDVVQTNLHLLRGACYLQRLQQLRQSKVAAEVVAEIWEPYFPLHEL